ncbi:MAG: hypothetical protein A07HN63_00481 [uncultured archaeon A07HN63]|nr:MAG: hypothetical protein A07HN63_00481 [uncultured archaeon A07HN63]
MRFARADGAQQELDSFLRAEAAGTGFHLVDELVDRLVDLTAVEDVLAVVEWVLGGERVFDEAVLLAVLCAVVVEHIGDTLVSVPCDVGILVHRVEIPRERPGFPQVVWDTRLIRFA